MFGIQTTLQVVHRPSKLLSLLNWYFIYCFSYKSKLIKRFSYESHGHKGLFVCNPERKLLCELHSHPILCPMVSIPSFRCGSCKKFSPTYDDVAAELAGQGSAIRLAKVDADQYGSLKSTYGIYGFPTLIFFKNGEVKSTLVGNQPKAEIIKNITSLI